MEKINSFIDNAVENQKQFLKVFLPEQKYRTPIEKMLDLNTINIKKSFDILNDLTIITLGEATYALLFNK